jgi:hypothetical protein
MFICAMWAGWRSRVLDDGLRFWIAAYWFLFGGIGVYMLLEQSDFTLVLTSCANQLLALTYLLAAGVGSTPNPLPKATQVYKWAGLSILIGVSSLLVSGLLLEFFEMMGGDVQQQGLVDLMSDGTAIEKFCTMILVVGLAPISEELVFRGTLLPWMIDKVGEWKGIVMTGLLFGLMHFETWSAVPPLILFGIVLGWWARHTGWVVFPILAHFCNNAFVTLSL